MYFFFSNYSESHKISHNQDIIILSFFAHARRLGLFMLSLHLSITHPRVKVGSQGQIINPFPRWTLPFHVWPSPLPSVHVCLPLYKQGTLSLVIQTKTYSQYTHCSRFSLLRSQTCSCLHNARHSFSLTSRIQVPPH
jgi:hypothetical protein